MAALFDNTSMFTESEPPKTVTDVYYTWDEEDVGDGDWERVRKTHKRQVANPAWASWNTRKQAFEVEKFKLDQTQVALQSFTSALIKSLEESEEEKVEAEKVAS